MADERSPFSMKAEAGVYRIQGSASGLANAAMIAAESFRSPREPTLLVQPPSDQVLRRMAEGFRRNAVPDDDGLASLEYPNVSERAAPKGLPAPKEQPAATIMASPVFKMIFVTVTCLTVAAIALNVILAGIWTVPTPPQAEVMAAMASAWKWGFGAIVGLLGGKVA